MVLPVLWPQLTPGHYAFCRTRFLSASASFIASLTGPPGVRHNSFAAQPPDLLLRFYVYLSGFGLMSNLAHRLALYPVSVRRLLGFATPFPPLLPLLAAACGSLHLVVNTRGGTFTRKNCAMPGTLKNADSALRPVCLLFLHSPMTKAVAAHGHSMAHTHPAATHHRGTGHGAYLPAMAGFRH